MIGRLAPQTQALEGGVTAQRFEMKYVLNEYQAERVRAFIQPFVYPDPKAKFGHNYPLSSVYLDSPRLDLFWSSNLGESKRFKLRVRTYTDDPDEPLFFEIKSRYNGIVMKKRATVGKQWMAPFFRGEPIPREAILTGSDSEYDNLQLFRRHVRDLNAIPRLHVRYMREAYMSRDDDPVRITFDTRIACLPSVGWIDKVRLNGRGWRGLLTPAAVLEIKFTDSYPAWVQEIPQRFSLLRDSFAKYVHCVQMLKDEGYDIKYPHDLVGGADGRVA